MRILAMVTSMLKKRRMLAAMLMISVMTCNLNCKKGADSPPNNNEFNAVVVLPNGSQVTINAKGSKAWMGCNWGSTYVSGANSNNDAVWTGVFNGGMCVNKAGTYTFKCDYRPDKGPIYDNIGVSNPGSITFTSISANTIEGFFNAVCRSSTNFDSVVVTGTFKGDFLK